MCAYHDIIDSHTRHINDLHSIHLRSAKELRKVGYRQNSKRNVFGRADEHGCVDTCSSMHASDQCGNARIDMEVFCITLDQACCAFILLLVLEELGVRAYTAILVFMKIDLLSTESDCTNQKIYLHGKRDERSLEQQPISMARMTV